MSYRMSHVLGLKQGSTTRTKTSTSPWSVRNQPAQQEVSSRPVSEASSVFTAAPQRFTSPRDGTVTFQENKLRAPTLFALQ